MLYPHYQFDYSLAIERLAGKSRVGPRSIMDQSRGLCNCPNHVVYSRVLMGIDEYISLTLGV